VNSEGENLGEEKQEAHTFSSEACGPPIKEVSCSLEDQKTVEKGEFHLAWEREKF